MMKLRVGAIRTLSLLVFLFQFLNTESFAERKGGVKSLFGSYKRDKYTENEARPTDIGFDVLLSTMMPVTSLVKGADTTNPALTEMQASLFYNAEASLFVTLKYNWMLHLTGGYYNYETRQQFNYVGSGSLNNLVAFRYYSLVAAPVLFGFKYRFGGAQDVVPYLGLAGGVTFYQRKLSFDFNDTVFDTKSSIALTGQASAGVEFYFLPGAGLKLEVSANFVNLPSETISVTSLTPTQNFSIPGNTFFVRYASGIFVLF